MTRGFSGGMMQRLSIARAMMHDPQVLFLDEPSAGLDPQTRLLLWEIIREYNQSGKTVLLTTHNMEEADALCQRLAIIDHGRMIALGTPTRTKELRAWRIPAATAFCQTFAGFGFAAGGARRRAGSASQRRSRRRICDGRLCRPRRFARFRDRHTCFATAAELSDVRILEPSLENLFLHHTGRSLRE